MYNIAVTGVGGGVGQSILKSLKDTEYNVLALDGDMLATGLYAAGSSRLIPYSSSPDYIESLLEICKDEKIDLLFPGLDAELLPLSLNRERFETIGTKVIVSSPDVIQIANNKMDTFNKLMANGVLVPNTFEMSSFDTAEIRYPLIVKQKVDGARSKNVFLVRDEHSWAQLREKITNPSEFIVMEYIEGDEYTCGSVTLDNSCKGVIVMKRILRDGDTYKCFSVTEPVVEEAVRAAISVIKPFGACNIQLRMKHGRPYIFEINARCSGTTAARALCGFNEPKMIADYLLKQIEPKFEIEELTILRYWKELVVNNKDVENMKRDQMVRFSPYNSL